MDTREWIFILGVIVMVIAALVVAAKWRRQRFDDIQSGDYSAEDIDEELVTSELPGGAARTVGYRDSSDIERMNDEIRARAEASKPKLSSFRAEPREQPSLLDDVEPDDDLDEGEEPENQVPLLLDPSDEHNQDTDFYSEAPSPVQQEPVATAIDQQPASAVKDQTESEPPESEPAPASPAAESGSAPVQPSVPEEDVQALESLAAELKESEPELGLRAEPDDQPSHLRKASADQARSEQTKKAAKPFGKARKPAPQKTQEQSQPEKPSEPGEIIIINLMTTPQTPFDGTQLYKVITELGMRYGDMQIFHYCGRHGDESPQFRMANLVKPGYFEIDAMDQTRTHALCFFFELLADQDNMKVYESMLSVINKIRDDMGGELHDENRSVFTIQTSEHCRNRIRDFQRRHLLAR